MQCFVLLIKSLLGIIGYLVIVVIEPSQGRITVAVCIAVLCSIQQQHRDGLNSHTDSQEGKECLRKKQNKAQKQYSLPLILILGYIIKST